MVAEPTEQGSGERAWCTPTLWGVARCRGSGRRDVGCSGSHGRWSVSQPATPTCSVHRPVDPGTGGVARWCQAARWYSVDEPARHIDALDRSRVERNIIGHRGDLETEPTVRAGAVVVVDV